jgi:S-(hydroxymethyl)glutathione dehydrogenase/alcohol dehydrogenase
MLGAHVTAVDLSLSRRVMASRFGAYSVMERMPDWRDSKFDVFVDCTGASSVIESGIYSAHKTILVGQPRADSQFFFHHPRELYSGKIIMDSQGGSTDPNGDIPRYLSAYMNGDLVDLDSLITHRFKLDEINIALDTMREGITGKCILEMN